MTIIGNFPKQFVYACLWRFSTASCLLSPCRRSCTRRTIPIPVVQYPMTSFISKRSIEHNAILWLLTTPVLRYRKSSILRCLKVPSTPSERGCLWIYIIQMIFILSNRTLSHLRVQKSYHRCLYLRIYKLYNMEPVTLLNNLFMNIKGAFSKKWTTRTVCFWISK